MSRTVKTLPSDFDIFSLSMFRNSTWTQNRANGLAGRALGLRDLVLVVREDQVDRRRHGCRSAAPRAAAAPWPSTRCASPAVPVRARSPSVGSPGLAGLPQHEIARVLLGVTVGVDPRAGLHPLVVEVRELAVVGQGRDAEVDRARQSGRCGRAPRVAGSCSPSRACWPRRSRGDSPRRARAPARRRPRGTPRCNGRCTRAAERRPRDAAIVLSSTSVKFVTCRIAEALHVPQGAAQHVEAHEGPEVADVPARVDRQAAVVHAHGRAVGGRELFFGCASACCRAA